LLRWCGSTNAPHSYFIHLPQTLSNLSKRQRLYTHTSLQPTHSPRNPQLKQSLYGLQSPICCNKSKRPMVLPQPLLRPRLVHTTLTEKRKTEHKPNTVRWNLTSWRLDRSFSEFFGFSLVNNHSTNSYQWPVLIIRMSGLAERYNAALCALPLDLTSRSVFVMSIFTRNHQPATLCSLNQCLPPYFRGAPYNNFIIPRHRLLLGTYAQQRGNW
jgi:hypothetical protein